MNRPVGNTDARRDDRIASAVFCSLLAAAALYLLFFVFSAGFERVLSVIPDDAAYFFEIAENVARGAGETFDGLNRTNGYQPLWLYVLVPVHRIGRLAPEPVCRIVLALQVVILSAAAYLLYAWCTRFFSGRVVLPCGIVFLVFVLMPAVNGMESALLVTLLAVLVVLGWKMRIDSPAPFERELLFGMVTGLVVLARLDMIFLPFIICLLCLLRAVAGEMGGRGAVDRGDRTGEAGGMGGGSDAGGGAVEAAGHAGARHALRAAYLRKCAAIGAGCALIVAPYLIRNHLVYGRVMPVSGALKSSFPRASLAGYVFTRMGYRDMASLAVSIGYLLRAVMAFFSGRGDKTPKRRDNIRDTDKETSRTHVNYFTLAVAVLSAAVLLHFIHTLLFMRWAVFRWHFLLYSFTAVLALCGPVHRVVGGLPVKWRRPLYRTGIVLLVGFCCLVTFGRYGGRTPDGWIAASYRAALWARDNTGPDDIFAMKDAGNFGHFSGRRVVSLDGIVNDISYQDAIRKRRLNAYLAGMGVDYLVQHAFWDRGDVTDGTYDTFSAVYTSRLYGVESDPVMLRRDWEVYRSEPYHDGPYRTVFLIWKLPGRPDGG